MKAWRVEAHGGSDALKYLDIPDPHAGPGMARVRVEAVGLNHLDVWVRRGVPGHQFPLPLTVGCDVTGVIDELGPGTQELAKQSGLSIGSPVLINPGVSCGRCQACLGGFDPLCPRYGILGEHRDGGCADFIVVPFTNLIARPAGLKSDQAVALPIPFLTAWTMLFKKAELKPGEFILIQAGGSGVSVAAIQMAKMIGAHVITTVGSSEKMAKARALGADHVINYREKPFREQLIAYLKSVKKRGVEVVVDHVGSDTFSESLKSLAWGGRLVTCGATSESDVTLDLKAVFFKNLSILGSTMGSKADLIRIVHLVNEGKLKPIVDSIFAMDELPKAMERLEARDVFGKIVVSR